MNINFLSYPVGVKIMKNREADNFNELQSYEIMQKLIKKFWSVVWRRINEFEKNTALKHMKKQASVHAMS